MVGEINRKVPCKDGRSYQYPNIYALDGSGRSVVDIGVDTRAGFIGAGRSYPY